MLELELELEQRLTAADAIKVAAGGGRSQVYEDEPELEWLRDKGRRLLRKHALPTEVARLPLPDEKGRVASNNKQTRDIEVWSLGQHWWVEKNLGKAWWNRVPLARRNLLGLIPVDEGDVPEPYGTTLLKGSRNQFRETVAAHNVGLGLESGIVRLVKQVKALTGEGRLSGICERTDCYDESYARCPECTWVLCFGHLKAHHWYEHEDGPGDELAWASQRKVSTSWPDHLEEWLRFAGGRRLATAGHPVVRLDSTPAFSGSPSNAMGWYLGEAITRSAAPRTDSTFLANRPREFRERTSRLFLADWRNVARPSQVPLVHSCTIADESLGTIDPTRRPTERKSLLSEVARRVVELTA